MNYSSRFLSIDDARADGFTHVCTLAGEIPLEQWALRDHIELQYQRTEGALVGAWRPATTFEVLAAAEQGVVVNTIAPQARDRWVLVKRDHNEWL